MTRTFAGKGADFFLLISNENFFGLREMDQHADMAVFRAIETRRPVLRATNTGRTCLIDPTGSVTSRIDRRVAGTLRTAVPLSSITPALPVTQALFGWACGVAAGIVMALACWKRSGVRAG